MQRILTSLVMSLTCMSHCLAQEKSRSSHSGNLPNPQVPSNNLLIDNTSPSVREVVVQSDQIPAPAAPMIESSARSSKPPESKLLSTASMIGPMEDAENLFSRLQIPDDWRAEERIIPTGTRESQDMIVWNSMPYTWTSPVFYHRPLYFEQPNLERYGNGPRRLFQPAISSAHFFMSAPLIPVKMLYNAPWSDIYTLGEGRPGNWVPWQTHTLIEE